MGYLDGSARLLAINHVTYNVTDTKRALLFWQDVLGVKQIPKQVDNKHLIWLQLPSGSMVHLVKDSNAPSVPSHHGAFEVEDIESAANRLISAGIQTTGISERKDGQRAFYIHDPDGNRIEICSKSGFSILV